RVGGRCGDKRRDRRLQRLWRKAYVVRLEEFAFERHAVFDEKLLNEAQSFERLRATVVLVHAEMFVLDRERAALCDAEIKPAFREDVDRRHVFGDLNGIAKGQQHRRGAEPKARRFRRQIRQNGETGWARSVGVEMVFGDPGFVETKRLDELNELRLLGIGRTVIVMRVLIGAEKSRSHPWAPYQLARCWFVEPMAPWSPQRGANEPLLAKEAAPSQVRMISKSLLVPHLGACSADHITSRERCPIFEWQAFVCNLYKHII